MLMLHSATGSVYGPWTEHLVRPARCRAAILDHISADPRFSVIRFPKFGASNSVEPVGMRRLVMKSASFQVEADAFLVL